jgi:hypothetical protein
MTTETTSTQIAGTPQGVTPETSSAPVADAAANLSGAELAAAFSRARRAASATPAPPVTPAPEQPVSETAPVETPVAEAVVETPTDTNTASTPAAEDEAIAPAADEAPATAGEDAPAHSETIAAMKARIDKVTARYRETERERDALKEKLANLEATPATPAPAAAPALEFGHDPEVRTLSQKIAELKAQANWLEENPNGGDVLNAKGEVLTTVPLEDARRLKGLVADDLSDARVTLGVRKNELRTLHQREVAQAEQLTAAHFAWVKEPESKGNQFIANLAARVPEIQRMPGWRLAAAAAFEKLTELAAKAQGQTAPKGPPKPPKIGPPSGASVPRVNGKQKALAEAEAVFAKTGRAPDFKRVLSLRRELQTSPG